MLATVPVPVQTSLYGPQENIVHCALAGSSSQGATHWKMCIVARGTLWVINQS